MTTMIKWQFPVLAATLLVAACDPFPAAPGGDPSVLRLTSNGAISQTQDHVAGDAAGKITLAGAQPDDVLYVQFNKPMNGAGVEGNVATSSVVLTGFNPATTVSFAPNAATDGGMYVIRPGAPMLLGVSYKAGGVATDYEGKKVTLDVTVTVDASLHGAAMADGYGVELSWFEAATPGTYLLETAPDVDGTEPTGAAWTTLDTTTVPPDCAKAPDSANGVVTGCTWQHLQLQPASSHWYRLSEGGTGRPVHPLVKTGTGRSVTLAVVGNAAGTGPIPGELRATWSSVTGANGYVLERSSATPAAWSTVYTVTFTGVGTDVDGASKRDFTDTGLTTGTTYSYRVHPTYASGTVVGPGPVKSAAAP